MKKLLCVFLCFTLGGCVGYRLSHVTGTIGGTNIQTPYGPATGNLQYEATTCFGNCPQGVTNATNIGPAGNTAK